MKTFLKRTASLASGRILTPNALHHLHTTAAAASASPGTALSGFPKPAASGFHTKTDEDKGGLEIATLGIASEIVAALRKMGITKLSSIQRAVLEPAMQGRDMIGRAKTGAGKTLAFGIPIMHKIIQFNAQNGCGGNPLCLVLEPTKELAKQVGREFRDSAPVVNTICASEDSPIVRLKTKLKYGVDAVVGTPGCIIDLHNEKALELSKVQFLVLDEADRLLQVGIVEDVEKILENLPKNRQSMMFSAIVPTGTKSLTQKHLKNPLTIDLVGESDQKLAEGVSLYSIAADRHGKASNLGPLITVGISLYLIMADKREKASILGPLIIEHAKGGNCIVFTRTKHDADQLAYAMARNFRCEVLHGDISPEKRDTMLSGFLVGHFNILVATDAAAYDIDIPGADLVIHYELPKVKMCETFVRRTRRAGRKGTAILIYTQEESWVVRIIEQEVRCRFSELPRIEVDSGSNVMFNEMGAGPRRTSGFGDFGSGNPGGFGDNKSGQSSGSGFGDFGSGNPGGFGNSTSGQSAGGFGSFGSGRSDDESNVRRPF